jgi:hypothetical protein
MTSVADSRMRLRLVDRHDWAAYLTAHSGLPGPRGNIELAQAVADEGDRALFDALIASDDEYLTFCGVLGLGAVLATGDDGSVQARLRDHAADPRWRVREAVAMALQRLGDAAPERLYAVVEGWAVDPDPLVQRAAVAGICEPRLLIGPEGAARSLATCERVTASLVARPASTRRDPGVRVLRQALGYCWSVAVAADPEHGLPAFQRLAASDDPDVVWIVHENRGKKRLARLL